MNLEALKIFIHNNEQVLADIGKKIIIPETVYLELLKHSRACSEKAGKALAALNIIHTYNDIFNIDETNISVMDVGQAFADSDLLSRITESIPYYRQLLITNDRGLAYDTYQTNNLTSCRGYKVMVCYINYFGELRPCDCVLSSRESKRNTDNIDFKDDSRKDETIEKGIDPWVVILPVFSFGMGIRFQKYGNTLKKSVDMFFKAISH